MNVQGRIQEKSIESITTALFTRKTFILDQSMRHEPLVNPCCNSLNTKKQPLGDKLQIIMTATRNHTVLPIDDRHHHHQRCINELLAYNRQAKNYLEKIKLMMVLFTTTNKWPVTVKAKVCKMIRRQSSTQTKR